MQPQTISFSEIDTYARCPHKHHWAYDLRLSKLVEDADPLSVGSLIHEGIAYGLNLYHQTDYRLSDCDLADGLAEFYNAIRQQRRPSEWVHDGEGNMVEDPTRIAAFEAMLTDVEIIVRRTLLNLHVNQQWRTVMLNGIPLIEYRAQYPINAHLLYVGQVDWVARNLEDGLIYVIDWKSRKNFEGGDDTIVTGEDFNVQISLYQHILSKMGIEVRGTITYQIAPIAPKTPEITKQKKVSRALIKTDWETYCAAVIANGEDPADYAEMREKLSHVRWWQPVTIYRTAYEAAARFATLQQWARIIDATRYQPELKPKAQGVMCKLCPFQALCLAEDRGDDVDEIISIDFTIRERTLEENENGYDASTDPAEAHA